MLLLLLLVRNGMIFFGRAVQLLMLALGPRVGSALFFVALHGVDDAWLDWLTFGLCGGLVLWDGTLMG